MNHQTLSAMVSKPDASSAFPVLLHRMLEDIEELGTKDPTKMDLQSIVSWQKNGTAFKVHDKKRFIAVVLPTWFPRIKHSSWVRLVNSFGFKKNHDEGEEQGFISHEMFLRGRPDLAKTIQKIKKGGKKTGSSYILAERGLLARTGASNCALNTMALAATPCSRSTAQQRRPSQVCLKDIIWYNQQQHTSSRALHFNTSAGMPQQTGPGLPVFSFTQTAPQTEYMSVSSNEYDWQDLSSSSSSSSSSEVSFPEFKEDFSDEVSYSCADLEPVPFRTNQTAAEAQMTNITSGISSLDGCPSLVEWTKVFED